MRPFTVLSRFMWEKIDMKIVDATVDMIAHILYRSGQNARRLQSGNLSDMLRWMVVGLVLLLAFAIFYRPMV